MKLKIYGCRGSLPIFNSNSLKYGGNTTCLRIFNSHIPENTALTIDAGSGFLALGHDILKNEDKITEIFSLFSHWHHDHILGLFHSPVLFIKKYKMHLIGPRQNDVGPKEMLESMMCPPYFPIDIRDVRGHFKYTDIKFPGREVILIHKLGIKIITAEELFHIENSLNQVIKIKNKKIPLTEFLVVKTIKTKHPDLTVSFRFEDRSTGKVFVFLTDHENQDGIPNNMLNHLYNADFLIVDCQYNREKYDKYTAGYGHSTPDYVAKLAQKASVKKMGITHHDPSSSDKDIDLMVEDVKSYINGSGIKVMACADFMEINL